MDWGSKCHRGRKIVPEEGLQHFKQIIIVSYFKKGRKGFSESVTVFLNTTVMACNEGAGYDGQGIFKRKKLKVKSCQ
jgi:hypothetical protein